LDTKDLPDRTRKTGKRPGTSRNRAPYDDIAGVRDVHDVRKPGVPGQTQARIHGRRHFGRNLLVCVFHVLHGIIGFGPRSWRRTTGRAGKNRCPTAAAQSIIVAFAAYPWFSRAFRSARPFRSYGRSREPDRAANRILRHSHVRLDYRAPAQLLAGFFSGIGRTRIVMISTGFALVISVIANHALIFGDFCLPAMGMTGAAIGMLIGSFAGLLVLVFRFLSPSVVAEFEVFKGLRFDRALMKKLLGFGYPSGIEFFLNMLAFNLLLLNLQSYGRTHRRRFQSRSRGTRRRSYRSSAWALESRVWWAGTWARGSPIWRTKPR